ncbi:TrwC relaxase domain protein, partial [mine drainage metagenome]
LELIEVPEGVRERFSARSAQVEAALADRGLDRGSASPDAKQAAALSTRATKGEIDHAALAARWRADAHALGYDPDRAAPAPAWPDPDARRVAAEAAVKQAAESLAERDARFSARASNTRPDCSAKAAPTARRSAPPSPMPPRMANWRNGPC